MNQNSFKKPYFFSFYQMVRDPPHVIAGDEPDHMFYMVHKNPLGGMGISDY